MQRGVVAAMVVSLAVLVFVRLLDAGSAPPADGVTTPPTVSEPRSRAATLDDSRGIRFEDVTAQVGLGGVSDQLHGSAGLIVDDFDSDGWPDLYLTNVGTPNQLYLNDRSGRFSDVASRMGVQGADPANGYLAATLADLTGDGCSDLYLAAARVGKNQLLVSDCSGSFRDETDERGVGFPPAIGDPFGNQQNVVVSHDVEGDGDIDLLVMSWYVPDLVDRRQPPTSVPERVEGSSQCQETNRQRGGWFGDEAAPLRAPRRSALFRNDGTGHFEDVTDAVGLPLGRILAVSAAFADIDGDGSDDLLVSGDLCTSRLFLNRGDWRFEDATDSAQVATGLSDMGSVVRDVDGDGSLDWFVTDIGSLDGRCGDVADVRDCSGNRLYINDGSGEFADRTTEFGVRQGWFGWGAVVADFGNDGRLAFAQVNSFAPAFLQQVGVPLEEIRKFEDYVGRPARFWLPGGKGEPFVDAASLVGLADVPPAQSLVAVDLDRDGTLDLVQRDIDGRSTVLRNVGAAAERHWLMVELRDPVANGNGMGVGSIVRVSTSDGGEDVQQITTTGSFASSVPARVHVGLGEHDEPVRVAVRWPGCDREQVLTDVRVDQRLVVTRTAEAMCADGKR